MTAGQVFYPTGQGEVEILFALNKWLLVRLPDGRSVQRQVSREVELAALLRELGLTEVEAANAAAEAWHQRPASAGLPAATARGSLRNAAGIPQAVVLLIVGGFVAVLSLLAVYAATHLP